MPKILIFEDDKMLGHLYATKFAMAAFTVAYYSHPEKNPVPVVLKEQPDIISTGIIMPELNGFELTQILKASPKTSHIPILGLDNLSQPEDLKKAKDYGMVEYMISSNHMPAEVVEHVCIILGLPKPVFDNAGKFADHSAKPRKWWQKIF